MVSGVLLIRTTVRAKVVVVTVGGGDGGWWALGQLEVCGRNSSIERVEVGICVEKCTVRSQKIALIQ